MLIVLVVISINSCKKDDDRSDSLTEENTANLASIDYINSYPLTNEYPSIFDAAETTDGGHIICGQLYNSPSKAIVLLTNNSGDSIWFRTISDTIDLAAISVIETTDKGLLVLCSHNLQTSRNIILVKLDKDGNELWRKDYAGGLSFNGSNKLLKTKNNTYTICGITRTSADDSNMYLLTVNHNGDSLSSQLFNNSNNETCNAAILSNDGGFILTGTGAKYDTQIAIRKVSDNKTELFSKIFEEGSFANAHSVTEDDFGNIYVLSRVQESSSNSLAISKLDKQGNLIFFKQYLTSQRDVYPRHIFLSESNQLIITTHEQRSPLLSSIIKIDLSGNLISRNALEYYDAYKTFEDSNGDLFITGTKGSNFAILKLKF